MKLYEIIDEIADTFLDDWWKDGIWRSLNYYLRSGIIGMANDYIATYDDFDYSFDEDKMILVFAIPDNSNLLDFQYIEKEDTNERKLTITYHSDTKKNYYPNIRRFFTILKHRGVKVTKKKVKNEDNGWDRTYTAVAPATLKEIRKLRRKSAFWDDMGFYPI